MSRKSAVIILLQNTPDQNYQLNTPMNGVKGVTIQNLSLTGMTSTGTSLVLYSSSFATNHADRQSQYNTAAGALFSLPIGWIQPDPLPTRTDQLQPIEIRFDVCRDFNSVFIQLGTNGTPTFAALQAEWLLTFYFD